jgi:hypothetical protein
MRDIAPGEELTHDWATTDDLDYVMECKCGSPNCRGTITGKDWMKKELQEKYKGWFCWFIQRKIDLKSLTMLMILIVWTSFVSYSGESDKVREGGMSEEQTLLPGLPDDIKGYEKWLKLNSKPIPPRSSDPHNGTKNVYINQARGAIALGGEQIFPYPDGSIIVKEAVRPGRDFMGLVAIIRKSKGSDPEHSDWTFIEYVRSDKDEAFREIARGAICWGCHIDAIATDYVFTRLE